MALVAKMGFPSSACAKAVETEEIAPIPEMAVSEVLGWLDRNKYALLAIAPKAPPSLASDEGFQRALAAEQEWYDIQRHEYAGVRQAWLDRGIDCLMIKSAGNAPSFPHLSDNIDVLVRPQHGPAARDTLRALGFVEVRNVEEPGKFLFRKFGNGRCVSAIHVHEQVAWFVGFMDEETLWERKRTSDDDPLVSVPSPEDAILINLAHACYENKHLRFGDVLRVRHALRTVNGDPDWPYMERVARSRGWLGGLAFMVLVYSDLESALFGSGLVSEGQQERFEAIVRADALAWRRLRAIRSAAEIDLPLDLSYPLCKWLYYRKILADPARSPSQRWQDAALTLVWGVKLKSGIRPQPGRTISLSGIDGSGKTAHAEALLDALRLCEIKADFLWSRGGSSGLARVLGHLRRALAQAPTAVEGADALQRRRARLSHPLPRLIWSWLVAGDQILTYLFRATLPSMVGRVVVCDRYVYDTAVEMDLSLPTDARWSRLAISAMLKLVQRPAHGFVLDVSSQTARGRKDDEPWHADLDDQRRAYIAMAQKFELRLISTDGAFADCSDVLTREVIGEYLAGFETWLNALFLSNPGQRNRRDLIWAPGEGQ